MEDAAQGLLFEAVIVPHRSLSRRGLRNLILALAVLSAIVATLPWLLGAWPVLGFSGAETVLAATLLLVHARRGRESEMLLLSAGGLRVVRTDRAGRKQERVLPASWLNVVLDESGGGVPRLWLACRGLREEVGAVLGEAEKRDLAASLQAALHRARHPVFDNPQLQE